MVLKVGQKSNQLYSAVFQSEDGGRMLRSKGVGK